MPKIPFQLNATRIVENSRRGTKCALSKSRAIFIPQEIHFTA
jgi:hypothetical protein